MRLMGCGAFSMGKRIKGQEAGACRLLNTGREAMEKEKKAGKTGRIPGYAGDAGNQGMERSQSEAAEPGLASFLRAIEGRRAVLRVPLGERKGEGNGGSA